MGTKCIRCGEWNDNDLMYCLTCEAENKSSSKELSTEIRSLLNYINWQKGRIDDYESRLLCLQTDREDFKYRNKKLEEEIKNLKNTYDSKIIDYLNDGYCPDSLKFIWNIKEWNLGWTKRNIYFYTDHFVLEDVETCANNEEKLREYFLVYYTRVRKISFVGEKGWEKLEIKYKDYNKKTKRLIIPLHCKEVPNVWYVGQSKIFIDEPQRQENLEKARKIINLIKKGGMKKKFIKKNN